MFKSYEIVIETKAGHYVHMLSAGETGALAIASLYRVLRTAGFYIVTPEDQAIATECTIRHA